MGYFLPFYPPNSPKNQNFEKMKKTPGDIIILHMCAKNYDQMMYGSWDMVCNGRMDKQTDRQTEGQMEKVTYRGGAPPKYMSKIIFKEIFNIYKKMCKTKLFNFFVLTILQKKNRIQVFWGNWLENICSISATSWTNKILF